MCVIISINLSIQGADGVAMGSRLAVTKESPLSQNAKETIVKSDENDTIYGMYIIIAIIVFLVTD